MVINKRKFENEPKVIDQPATTELVDLEALRKEKKRERKQGIKDRPEEVQALEQRDQELFKGEQVESFVSEVERQEATLEPTSIQQEEEVRQQGLEFGNRIREREKDRFIRQKVKQGMTLEEAEEFFLMTNPEERAKAGIQGTAMGLTEKVFARLSRTLGGIGGDLIGLDANQITDILTSPEDASQLESALGKLGETFSGIRGLADNDSLEPTRVLALLNQQEDNINILNQRITRAVNENPELKTTGEYVNILTELDKTRIELTEARGDVLQTLRERDKSFNILETRAILDRLGA